MRDFAAPFAKKPRSDSEIRWRTTRGVTEVSLKMCLGRQECIEGHVGGWGTRSPAPRRRNFLLLKFGYEEGPRVRRLLRLETEEGPRVRRWLIFMADDLLERAARRRAATASSLQLHVLPHRHPLMHRSGSARGRHGLGRSVTCHSAGTVLPSKHPQRPAAGSIPAQADARRGLLHERALVHDQDLEEVRRVYCHCILLP